MRLLILLVALPWSFSLAWTVKAPRFNTALPMGLMDSLSGFLNQRQGDFIKLEQSEVFGPGPLLLLYGAPSGIDDQEIADMLEDGAPKAWQKGVRVHRLSPTSLQLDEPMEVVLEELAATAKSPLSTPTKSETLAVPVLFFSGFANEEMMAVYDILGKEIYRESAGLASPACAKAVPNAMAKPLRQVLEEISGDHTDAMNLRE